MKNQLISELARRKVVERYVCRFRFDRELLKDLAQEVYIALLEFPENKIVNLGRQGGLIPFALAIARTMIFSTTSQFYYKYLRYEKYEGGNQFYCEEFSDDQERI
ncbi:MAG: hypothetical protein LUG98_05405 [Tannerellaceae bacterium]|nr:hypothetical protein [Tannerellaceae bacterium]